MSEAIKKSDVVQGEPFNDIAKEMQATILVLEKFDTGVKNVAKSLELISKESKTTVQGINNITQAEKESQKLVQQKMQNDKALEKMRLEEIRIQKAREKSIDDYNRKAAKEEAQAKKNASAYNQLAKSTRDLKNQSKDLGATMLKLEADGKKNTEQYRKLAAQYKDVTRAAQQGDAQLKKLDKTVGDNFRNVGNYEQAVGKLKNVLGQLGLVVGVGAAVKNVFGIIKDFDQGVANLASVLGTTREGVVKLEEDAKRLGATTAFTASQVSQLQVEFAKLGFTEQEILAATEATLNLAAATGSDLGRAAEVAGATVRAMGLTAEDTMHVTDVMAKSFSTSALDMEKFAESMKVVAPIANAAGVSLEDTTAMLGALANAGISGSNAGTALRRILSEVATTGKPVKEALKELAEKGLDLADAEDEVGKNAMSALLVLSKQTEKIDELSDAYVNADGAAKEMADTQLNTLGGAIALLTSAWEGFVLQMNDASGAGSGLTKVIKFLADNFNTIMSVLGKLIKVWIAYKAVLFGMKMADRIKEMIAYNKAVKDGSVVAGGATEGVKKFGAALKGIGLGLAIGLALELAQAFWDIASGAKYAREEKERMDKAMAAGTSSAEKVLAKSNENLKEQLRLLDLEIRERKANGEDEKKLTKEKVEREKELTEAEFKGINNRIKFKENALSRQLQLEDKLRAATTIGLKPGEYEAVNKELSELYGINTKGVVIYGKALLKVSAATTRITQEIVELNEGKKELSKLTQDLNVQVIEETAAVKEDAKERKKSNKEIDRTKEKLAALQAFLRKTSAEYIKLAEVSRISLDPDAVEAAIMLEIERSVVMAEIALLEAEIALSKAQQVGDAKAIAAAEERVKDAKIAVINAQKEADLFVESDPAKRVKIEKQAEKDILELNEQVTDSYKDRFDTINRVQQAITDVLQEQIDRRIALLQKEADAAKSQQDFLQDLAANGNITAQQSIAEQIQIQREAQAEQMRLEKQKQQIELISQGLSTFNAELGAGKSPAQALASTIVSTQALVGFLRNLNFYEKGTDNAPGGVAVVDEKGAEIITDKQGRIKDIGTGEGARFVNLSKGDKVITATKTAQILNAFGNVQNGTMIGKGKEVAGNSYDIMKLNTGLNRIEQAIKNKPEYQVHWDTFGTVERVRKGGDIVTNRYRVK